MQPHNGVTPLMCAAKTSSTEAVTLLLEKGADPDVCNGSDGSNALSLAFSTGNMSIIQMLCNVTEDPHGFNSCITALAKSNIKIISGLKKFIQKLFLAGKTKLLMEKASFYGNSVLLDYILTEDPNILFKCDMNKITKNVIMSDNPEACETILEHCKTNGYNIPVSRHKKLIFERGNSSILKSFGLTPQKRKSKFRITEQIPKSADFSYSDIMEKILPLVMFDSTSHAERLVSFAKMLGSLHVSKVHYDSKNCVDSCLQKEKCARIRDTIQLLKDIMEKMSEENPIFKRVETVVVGSLKEDTKIDTIDEADIILALNNDYKQYFEFDPKSQVIKVIGTFNDQDKKDKKKLDEYIYTNIMNAKGMKVEIRKMEATKEDSKDNHIPNEWKPFIKVKKNDYILDTDKYFFNFIESFHKIIKSVNLPDGLKLSTEFVPCEVCQIQDHAISQNIRCHHNHDCEDHRKKLEDINHKESCNCRNFTSPCITYSKIGLVWHLEYVQPDGSLFNIDVDISPPSIPFKNDSWEDFDGSNQLKRDWLKRMRPYLWLSELSKTHNMSEASGIDDGLRRSIRLRFFNLDTVIAEQVNSLKVFTKNFIIIHSCKISQDDFS